MMLQRSLVRVLILVAIVRSSPSRINAILRRTEHRPIHGPAKAGGWRTRVEIGHVILAGSSFLVLGFAFCVGVIRCPNGRI